MAQLAIKGHVKRGKEVIQLLEMLGGKSNDNMKGYNDDLYYYIAKDGLIYGSGIEYEDISRNYTILTLEDFLEKFPYKVGDKMTLDNKLCSITWMCWECNNIYYQVQGIDTMFTKKVTVNDLQPYEEENYCQVIGNDTSSNGVNTSASLIIEENMEEKGTLVQIDLTKEMNVNDEVEVILGDYEFVLKDGKTYFIKKKPQYPKDYDECCDVLGILDNRGFGFINLSEYENVLMSRFIQLKRCRDAYWKIAGAEMGLDKPWEPDWEENDGGYRYCIRNLSNKIVLNNEWVGKNYILSFPTEEMRDAFYENFKDLIENCKELL